MHKKIILISSLIIQLCSGTLFGMELVPYADNKGLASARSFIQKFPNMTFQNTRIAFDQLDQLVQAQVWQQLNQNQYDKDKILPFALKLASLEEKLQYTILAQDCNIKDKNLNDIKKIMANNTIKDLFAWHAAIAKRCKNNNFLAIDFGTHSYNPITFTKQELFQLTLNQIKTIKKITHNSLTKNELILLSEIPNDPLERLKPLYIGTPSKKISFYYQYKKPLRQAAVDGLTSCRDNLPRIIASLLYSKFCIEPTWENIPKNRDTFFLLIPFKKAYSSPFDFYKPLSPIGLGLPIWYAGKDAFDLYTRNPNKIETTQYFFKIAFLFSKIASIASIIISPITYYTSKLVFAYGIPAGLAGITFITSLYGIIQNRSSVIRENSIDFNAKKYRGMSVKDIINSHLNNPNIEIHD